MPRYLDIHTGMQGVTLEALAEAHAKDVAVQGRHDVRYLRYWFDPATGRGVGAPIAYRRIGHATSAPRKVPWAHHQTPTS